MLAVEAQGAVELRSGDPCIYITPTIENFDLDSQRGNGATKRTRIVWHLRQIPESCYWRRQRSLFTSFCKIPSRPIALSFLDFPNHRLATNEIDHKALRLFTIFDYLIVLQTRICGIVLKGLHGRVETPNRDGI